MRDRSAAHAPTLLVGAFDRHNFGDLLFPHLLVAQMPHEPLLCVGLAARDLSEHGGHSVQALADVATQWRAQPVRVVHAGGEILTCSAWQSAVMLLPPDAAQATIAYLQGRPRVRRTWVRDTLGVADLAPYCVSRALFPRARQVDYHAVGGVGLAATPPALRAEVLAKLAAADHLTVRDERTLVQLQAAGLAPRLLPDAAVLVAELFGATIRHRGQAGLVAEMLRTFPRGYLAVQCSAEFRDDATLQALAGQLTHLADATGLGLVLFRAGAAPWHDDLALLQGLAARLPAGQVRVFPALHLWDICALVAHSRGYGGSSLHGRIVAMAFALPRVSLHPPAWKAGASKTAAFAASWEPAGQPGVVPVPEFAEAMQQALAVPPGRLRQTARDLVAQYRAGVADWLAGGAAQ